MQHPVIDPRLVSALGDRYRLVGELGAGGMATVYLAEDLKHGRPAAVKVLRRDLAEALGRDRFQREIATMASLRHPNILPLFDSGESDGFLFYVMPVIEGESLRARFARAPRLPVADALRFADEVADALGYAHGRGIVHRDIKPENILIERDHAIVADFGIAHAIAGAGDGRLTMTGMVVGTPQYMSPEQGRGDAVDARADLYALGCVLFEMLAGAPPYVAPTALAVMARHLTDPVPRLRATRPDVPAHISDAVERALAKAPGERFPTVQAWRAALGTASGAMAVVDATPTVAATQFRSDAVLKVPPAPATSLVGRDEVLAKAEQLLQPGAGVLTITGPGGAGKTRFGVELFRRVYTRYPGGAAFVSLASVTEAREVMTAVSVALGIAEAHGRTALDAVATLFGDRQALLLLDNLEQVIDAAGDIASLSSRCPRLQVIATSQAPLRIAAEVELPLAPLELPPVTSSAVDDVARAPAVTLFVQRAARVRPGFAVTTANAADIAAICRRLDGLPLALELAAARIRILDAPALRARLDRALDLLTSGDRDLPDRHRTLRAAVAWSYSLLDAAEQRLLRRLSVFAEGCTFDAMEAVCYGDAERHHALDELSSLVEKGLLQVSPAGGRYRLLETIREFAGEQLDASGEAPLARGAHLRYFADFARDVAENIMGEAQLEAMARFRAEQANTQAAIHWATSRARAGDRDALEQGLLLCGGLDWPWHIAGQHLSARGQVSGLLELAADLPASEGRALARMTSAMVGTATGDMEGARRDARLALDDARAIDRAARVAEAEMMIGYACLATGRMDEARQALASSISGARASGARFLEAIGMTVESLRLFLSGDVAGGLAHAQQAREIQEALGDYEGRGLSISFLAQMRFASGDLDAAAAAYRESLEAFETIGDRPEVARVQGEIGWTALAAQDAAGARRWFLRSLRAHDETGSARGLGQALIGLAAVESAMGRPERAVEFAAAARVMSERAGVVIEHPMAPDIVARIEALKATVPGDARETLVARGRSLTPAAVLALAGE